MKSNKQRYSKGRILYDNLVGMRLLPRLCPSCREKVDPFATKCPHCQSDLENLLETTLTFKNRVFGILVLLGVFALLFLICFAPMLAKG